MYYKGSQYLNESLFEQKFAIPESFSKEAFTQESWNKVMTSVKLKSSIYVEVQVSNQLYRAVEMNSRGRVVLLKKHSKSSTSSTAGLSIELHIY